MIYAPLPMSLMPAKRMTYVSSTSVNFHFTRCQLCIYILFYILAVFMHSNALCNDGLWWQLSRKCMAMMMMIMMMMMMQSLTWIGSIHGLQWVGLDWVGWLWPSTVFVLYHFDIKWLNLHCVYLVITAQLKLFLTNYDLWTFRYISVWQRLRVSQH